MQPDTPLGNPLLDAFLASDPHDAATAATRDALIARYGFAIPDDDALDAIVAASPHGIVEIGAGTGYWARLLHDRMPGGIRAFDTDPPPSVTSAWFAGSMPWFEVRHGDETVADQAAPSTLLLVWPTRNETWGMDAAQRHHAAGGTTLVFVGEGPGGHTGDDGLHATLGELSVCAPCRYGVVSSPCICEINPRWRRVHEIMIPTWPGFGDSVRIYERVDHPRRRSRFSLRRG